MRDRIVQCVLSNACLWFWNSNACSLKKNNCMCVYVYTNTCVLVMFPLFNMFNLLFPSFWIRSETFNHEKIVWSHRVIFLQDVDQKTLTTSSDFSQYVSSSWLKQNTIILNDRNHDLITSCKKFDNSRFRNDQHTQTIFDTFWKYFWKLIETDINRSWVTWTSTYLSRPLKVVSIRHLWWDFCSRSDQKQMIDRQHNRKSIREQVADNIFLMKKHRIFVIRFSL